MFVGRDNTNKQMKKDSKVVTNVNYEGALFSSWSKYIYNLQTNTIRIKIFDF